MSIPFCPARGRSLLEIPAPFRGAIGLPWLLQFPALLRALARACGDRSRAVGRLAFKLHAQLEQSRAVAGEHCTDLAEHCVARARLAREPVRLVDEIE